MSTQWTLCSERLPPPNKRVLVYDDRDSCPDTCIDCLSIVTWNPWDNGLRWSRGEDDGYYDMDAFTHWAPLPERPAKLEENPES